MNRLSVLILFGGESSEHEVSIMSARNVYAAMDGDKYDTHLGYIDKHGKWWLLDSWVDNLEQHGGKQLLVAPGTGTLMAVPGNAIIKPDVLFPVLHGKNGEDGTVQGLAEMAHIPYVGCGIEASALGMDKLMAKKIVSQSNIKIASYIAVTSADEAAALVEAQDDGESELAKRLGTGAWFVKPARAGSSVGVSKVEDASELVVAVAEALKHDTMALIEQGIVGREIEVAVLGNPPHHEASGLGEILIGDTFYSYDDKYASDSRSQTIINPEMPDETIETVRQQAEQVYALLCCTGLSRVDFFVTPQNEVYFNEINTMPGFTNISMYPKLWRAAGLHYPQLVDKLIQVAINNN